MSTSGRSISLAIQQDLEHKLVLISGPRQVGKTTLAKNLYAKFVYINYDSSEDRLIIEDKSWDRKTPLVIFDEIHKMQNWKSYLKGIYDTEGHSPKLLVTGSARLDTYRKTGDSLAGRFFNHRLFPLDLKELVSVDKKINLPEAYETLIKVGGFPEPFFKGTQAYYNRWKKSHIDIILRQDLIDLEQVRNIIGIETLIQLMRRRVGGTISYATLARDIQVDAKTIKSWLTILENLFVIFKVLPYTKKITRSLLKEPKYYFFDNGLVLGDEGAKLENLVANTIFKNITIDLDSNGIESDLYFLRTKDGKEIDFCIKGPEREIMIEVKVSDDNLANGFSHFKKFLPNSKQLQLVKNLKREKSFPDGAEIRRVIDWLAKVDLD